MQRRKESRYKSAIKSPTQKCLCQVLLAVSHARDMTKRNDSGAKRSCIKQERSLSGTCNRQPKLAATQISWKSCPGCSQLGTQHSRESHEIGRGSTLKYTDRPRERRKEGQKDRQLRHRHRETDTERDSGERDAQRQRLTFKRER